MLAKKEQRVSIVQSIDRAQRRRHLQECLLDSQILEVVARQISLSSKVSFCNIASESGTLLFLSNPPSIISSHPLFLNLFPTMGFFSSKKRQDRSKPQISDPITEYYRNKPLPPVPSQPKKYQAYNAKSSKKPANLNKPLPKLPREGAFKGDPMASFGNKAGKAKVVRGLKVKSMAGQVCYGY